MSKKTLSAIAESGNDYLVKVKANQPKLYQQIETVSNQQIPQQKVELPFKDVITEEDISPQKAGFAPRNLSLLKTWVLTLLRVHGFDSIKGARALN